jgi:tetratricopeptide (TPR) repeat protein
VFPASRFPRPFLRRILRLQLGLASALLLVLAGCQTLPPAPTYVVDQPDGSPPVHRALRERDEERLAGATELLQRGDAVEGRRASLLSQRANAQLTLGHYAAAVSDLQEAIRLVPAHASLRLQLARVLWALDRETEALEQVAAARTLAPDEAAPHVTEGFIHLGAGRWDLAGTSFSIAAAYQPENAYTALFLAVARQRIEASTRSAIEGPMTRALETGLWPVPILEMMLGVRTPEELAAAAQHPDPLVQQTWQTEVAFFLGERAMRDGDMVAAAEHYREALRRGVPHQVEFVLARQRLRTFGETEPESGIAVVEPPGVEASALPAPDPGEEWSEESTIDVQIHRLVRSGAIDQAILRLREASRTSPSEDRLQRLASLQAQTGRATEALATWRSSLRGDASDWQPLAAIGWLELQLALEQGTSSGHAAGNMLAAALDPWTYFARREGDRHLAAAREAFDQARQLNPDEASLARTAAQMHLFARDFTGALELWRELRAPDPDDRDLIVGEASALIGLGRFDEAQPLLQSVLAAEINHAGARAAAAELARRTGRRADARRESEWAAFAAMLPRGSALAFTPVNAAKVEGCAARELTIGPFVVNIVPPERRTFIAGWMRDRSDESTELLAAAWWNSPADDPDVLRTARELHTRGRTGLLRDALDEGGNPVAVGAAARVLAEAGETTIYNRLIELLEQDLDRSRPADIAGALAALGEYRAAMPLAAVLDPEFRSSPRFSLAQEELSRGYLEARARAALALSAFDSGYARAALEAGTRNPEIALYCHAALFAQTKEPEHWNAIATAARYTDFIEARRTFALLRETGDPTAVAAADAWQRRQDERDKRNRRNTDVEFDTG